MGTIPKPPIWRLQAGESNGGAIYFKTQLPAKWRRRVVERIFGWRFQVRLISGEFVDV